MKKDSRICPDDGKECLVSEDVARETGCMSCPKIKEKFEQLKKMEEKKNDEKEKPKQEV